MRTVILVIGKVNDAPNQIGFQRIAALADQGNLHVVTTAPLPETLKAVVSGEHPVPGTLSMWKKSLELVRRFSNESDVVVHTVWGPRPLVAGYICKLRARAYWVYDLYDHPSLTWRRAGPLAKFLKRAVWGLLSRLVRKADVWVIGMHPGILSHMPTPNPACELVLTGPGTSLGADRVGSGSRTGETEIGICYAGPVNTERGIGIIAGWARQYEGPPACLHLMGRSDSESSRLIDEAAEEAKLRGLRIVRYGWVPHSRVVETMHACDIGLCLLDPDVLNYRFAYPVKIVEYMAHGLIPVASAGHGVKSLVRHGENGFISSYTIDGFARTMKSALAVAMDSDARRKYIENGTKDIDRHNWQTVNKQLIADLDVAYSFSGQCE